MQNDAATVSATKLVSPFRVAYQGEPGAFSEQAVLELGSVIPVPCRSFADLFLAAIVGRADQILAPVENFIAGRVAECCDRIDRAELFVITEIGPAIRMQLIGLPGADRAKIRRVRSHPVALAQCGRYLADHPAIIPETAADTAGSVREIVELRDPSIAAIASERAAALYGGTILDRDIHDNPQNFTRFLLLSAEHRR